MTSAWSVEPALFEIQVTTMK